MLHVLILTCVLDCSTLITAEVNLSPFVTCPNIDCCVLDCSTLITAEVNLSPYVTCPNIDCCVLDCSTLITAEVNLSPYVACPNIDCCVLDCSTPITAEVNLSPYATCYIPNTCTSIDCCIELPGIQRKLHTNIDIDTCSYKLTVDIEKVHLEYSLINYEWGKKEAYSLFGLLNLK
jgi:hypothetical protein